MNTRAVLRLVLAAFFIGGCLLHFRATDALVAITPEWVPYPREVVYATGILEAVGGLALLVPKLRWYAGVALAAYVIAVWPANIKHAVEGIVLPPVPDSWWYHGPRLALQPAIAWACIYAAEVIDWPWRKKLTVTDERS